MKDSGCGIAEADLPHLFRPFFRSEAARKSGIPGVGLGLAVANRIAYRASWQRVFPTNVR